MPPVVVPARTKPKIVARQFFLRAIRRCAGDSGRLRAGWNPQVLARQRLKFESAKLRLGSAASRPCSLTRFTSHSQVESPPQLPRLAKNSSEPELRSRGRPFSGKLRQTHGD